MKLSRRAFIRVGACLTASTAASGVSAEAIQPPAPEMRFAGSPPEERFVASPPDERFAAGPIEEVRIGLVGVGRMGMNHVNNLLRIEGCRIAAVCDIVEERTARVQDMTVKAGFPRPTGYSRGDRDFERMCAEEDLDLVYTATPWRWHVPVCVAAMENGKHAATEVPAATTAEDCWRLVEAAVKYRKHCVMVENCCYGRSEMQILRMVREGEFGTLLHGEGGYLHDLREVKFDQTSEGLWRREHSIRRNGNLYPTHGLGPIAQCMNINRGDRFAYLVSMSSPAAGLDLYAEDHLPEGDPRREEQYTNGDVNTSLVKTQLGRTIVVQFNVDSPRPYSRINMLQGTRAVTQGFPDLVHIEGRSAPHAWDRLDKYRPEFEHPLWKKVGPTAHGTSHGGMDYMADYRLIACLRRGNPTDMDVYDAAAWSVVGPLSERSVANRSEAVVFPDFTRGRWQTWEPLGIVGA